MKSIQFAAHNFSNLQNAPFDVKQYSRLKFGSDVAAREMGKELADKFFESHGDIIMSAEGVVVIPSPYNYVKNAATIMTEWMIKFLNEKLIDCNGKHVDCSIIHRKAKILQDYGHLTREMREGILDQDEFYINIDFIKDKLLVFVDDCVITGTHEKKLKEIMVRDNIKNDHVFLYYTRYLGEQAEIEGKLNFADLQDHAEDYFKISNEPNHHVIVRPLKLLLSMRKQDLTKLLSLIDTKKIEDIYFGCIGEGYYSVPMYQNNFQIIKDAIQ